MSNIKQEYNTGASLTITLASLANGSGRASTAIDNSTNKFISADIRVKIKTASSGVSGAGYCSIYLVRSEDGTNFDDSFGGTDAALTPINSTLLGVMTTNSNGTTYNKVIDTNELGLTLPAKWSIAIVNSSGAALDSTAGNHSITIREKYITLS